MDQLIIGNGDKELKIRKVEGVLKKSEDFLNGWISVARALEISTASRLDFEFRLNHATYHKSDIPNWVLHCWKANAGKRATLMRFCTALFECGMYELSESLQHAFCPNEPIHLPVKIIWNDKLLTLNQLLGDNVTTEFYNLLKSELLEKYRYGYSQPMPLLKKMVHPVTRPYYIPRTLRIFGKEINVEFFKANSSTNNLFLIKGISLEELAFFTNYKAPIGKSVSELDRAVQLILIEHDKDYQRICSNTKQTVHVLEFNDTTSSFSWIKSNNMLECVQPFLLQYTLKENEMLAKISSTSPPCAFILIDSPGMGKTLTLNNWAKEILENNSRNGIVIFIVMQEFFQNTETTFLSLSSTIDYLADYCSTDSITKIVLEALLTRGTVDINLFMDGYDEILNEKLEVADSFLNHIKTLGNLKIFVTARHHMKTRLENILCEHAIEILPFDESNQIKCLTNYWIRKHDLREGEKLNAFAEQCLKALQTELTETERDIAGVPLQCRMLAEVYAEDAVRHFETKSETLTPIVRVTSLSNMYRRLTELKFSRIPANIRQNYINVHRYYSISWLFKDWAPNFRPVLWRREEIDENILYFIGLLERCPHSNTPKFLHRTYAEYIVATFIVEDLHQTKACAELLLNKIWGRNGIDVISRAARPDIAKFKTNGMPYFIETHLEHCFKQNRNLFDDVFVLTNRIKYHDIALSIVATCFHDFENSFDLAAKLLHDKSHASLLIRSRSRSKKENLNKMFFTFLAHLTVEHSDKLSLVQKVLQFLKNEFKVDAKYSVFSDYGYYEHPTVYIPNCTLLHVAINKGNYNVVTYLMQQYRPDEVLCEKYLIHSCIMNSIDNGATVVKQKLTIVDLLVRLNRDWLEEILQEGRTPLLQREVHLLLLKRMVEHGANINITNALIGTLLHTANNREGYRNLTFWAFNKNFNRINDIDKNHSTTPLMVAFDRLGEKVDEEMLDWFYQKEADFNAVDIFGESVLFRAIKWPISIEVICKLIEYGADVNYINEKSGESVAHIIVNASYNTLERLKLIISKGFTKINLYDNVRMYYRRHYWKTAPPLIRYIERSKSLDNGTLTLFRDGKANFNCANDQQNSLLFHALKYSNNINFISKLIDSGANVNHINKRCECILDRIVNFVKDPQVALKLIHVLRNKGYNMVYKNGSRKPLLIKAFESYKILDEEMLKFFYEVGVDFNAQDMDGNSVVFYALVHSEDMNYVLKLLNFEAKINHRNHWGEGLLDKVFSIAQSSNKALAMMKALKENGYLELNKSNYLPNLGRKPLILRFIDRYRTINNEILEFFKEIGVNFNIKDEHGDSLLSYALYVSEDVDLIAKLVNYGANIHSVNARGESVAHLVIRYRKVCAVEFLEMLETNGFNLNNENFGNNTLLNYAKRFYAENNELIAFLKDSKKLFRLAITSISSLFLSGLKGSNIIFYKTLKA